MTPTKHSKSSEFLLALANLIVLSIVAAASTISIIQLVNHFALGMGDVIAFDPARGDAEGVEARIEVKRADLSTAAKCVLDVRMMRKSGGSLAIEAMRFEPKIEFRVHWAGGPTGDGQASCGTSAELLLSQSELAVLKMAALK